MGRAGLLEAAYLLERRAGWPGTCEDAMRDSVRAALIRLRASRLARARASVHELRPLTFDWKKAQAGDMDDR